MIVAALPVAQPVTVHLSDELTGFGPALVEAGFAWTRDGHGADVVLAGPNGWPAGGAPVVSLGGRGAAAGKLAATASLAQITAALMAVAAGLSVQSPGVADDGFAPASEPVAADLLTPREFEVLNALAAGDSNKQIARRLGISLHTVKFYVETIFRKLDVHSRAEAVAQGMIRQRAATVSV